MIPTRGAGLHEHAHFAENEVSWQQKLQLFREGVYASKEQKQSGKYGWQSAILPKRQLAKLCQDLWSEVRELGREGLGRSLALYYSTKLLPSSPAPSVSLTLLTSNFYPP